MFDQTTSIVYNPISFYKPDFKISKDLGNTECQSELINQKFGADCVCMASGSECQLLMGGRC
jgi:hypothetical protein